MRLYHRPARCHAHIAQHTQNILQDITATYLITLDTIDVSNLKTEPSNNDVMS